VSSVPPTKICRKCGQMKPLIDFNRSKDSPDNHKHICRACANAQTRAWRRQNADRVRDYKNYYNDLHPEKNRERANRWYRANKSRARAANRARRQAMSPEKREAYNAYYRAYFQVKQYRKRNAKKIAHRKYMAAYLKEYLPRYRRANRERINASWHARRARVRAIGGSFTKEQWRALCKHFGNVCLCCGNRGRLTKDHVIPIEQGGLNTIANLQPLCRSCNSAKGTRYIDYRDPEHLRVLLESLEQD